MKSNLILILAVVLFFTALWYLELLIPFFVMYFILDFFTDWRIMRRKSKENDQKLNQIDNNCKVKNDWLRVV